MATDTLRIGIIGAGANTRSRHIPGSALRSNSIEIVGVANPQFGVEPQRRRMELDILEGLRRLDRGDRGQDHRCGVHRHWLRTPMPR